jgi:hypothetical protein
MPFYEVIYETGAYSVVQADTDEAALEGIKAHHARALEGIVGGPTGHPAERVKRVLKYDEHPGDYMGSGLVTAKEAKAAVDAVAVGDQVSVWEAAAAIRNLVDPLANTAAHESNYKAPEVAELEEAAWQ